MPSDFFSMAIYFTFFPVTSVLDSVIDSMSTSMEIAEKFVKDEVTAGENGVSKFAEVCCFLRFRGVYGL